MASQLFFSACPCTCNQFFFPPTCLAPMAHGGSVNDPQYIDKSMLIRFVVAVIFALQSTWFKQEHNRDIWKTHQHIQGWDFIFPLYTAWPLYIFPVTTFLGLKWQCLLFHGKALGDDRRSFSYYKAIPVVEKLPFKIESADQVKDLPGIGKSMQDHVRAHFCSNYYVHISSLD